MRTIYIEPPAHLNSCPARKVLLERSMLVEKHKFGIRKFILQKNQRSLFVRLDLMIMTYGLLLMKAQSDMLKFKYLRNIGKNGNYEFGLLIKRDVISLFLFI